MAWVRFSHPWDYRQPGFTIAYPAGDFNVTRDAAEKAINAGVAVRLRKLNKNDEAVEWPSEAEPAPSAAG
ncbi:hypothetical protein RFN29_30535 [Mesorhizobium sp. VK22B]|uniref:Uncharacterized protein n=1 Tax=Mesorhizobium captivum TaxID=3072319 RepID=A0ABU4Z9J5_9HYPH|nr:hypothetical protein [Mesorhizobium sp. VK22B]